MLYDRREGSKLGLDGALDGDDVLYVEEGAINWYFVVAKCSADWVG